MDDTVPQIEVVERRHEVSFKMTVCEIVDGISEHAERQHVRKHHAEDGSDHHVHPTDRRHRLTEPERREHYRPEDETRFELERMGESAKEVFDTKTLFDRRDLPMSDFAIL